ncbi:RNA-binding domain-containing protein [Basidiobolus meristosporus CBS 931.73]|uniref:RNA-binding domain-containing protein n=1 Tax=Basidiobolus meristosporus CBS 931.73 TaxID=1314790 RepID=A0A1Y1XJ00_9FUNG|nr:RNA-binding domain-containing protein [Basidiobolus meristosporus CBS 931.73]|eukprot:ORX85376.1 RNA-binding domain-containing protein [Basidiobolus meristosporus CBS 931.73]
MAESQGKKKNKGQKLSLADFLNDQNTGSWADEMAELPSAPAAATLDGDRPRGGFGDSRREGAFGDSRREGSRGGFGERSSFDRPQRGPQEIPDVAPFTAYIGNLPFDLIDADVEDFFAGSKVTSVRLVRDKMDDKPKGFGYVEFEDRDSLVKALDKNGSTLNNRAVRVNVADPPRDRPEERNWRREGPADSSRSVPERSFERRGDTSWGSNGTFKSNFENRRREGEESKWNSAPRRREAPSTFSDSADNWRTSRPSNRPNPFAGAKPKEENSQE